MATNYAIEIENLYVNYDPSTPALENINLKIPEYDYLGIIGPNGGGKSTLIKCILHLIDFHQGTIKVFGSKQKNQLISYVPQVSGMEKSFPISVREVILTSFNSGSFHPFRRFSKEEIIKANSYLDQVQIKHLADRQISGLSGGESQRLLIARALAFNPKILLLDEPTSNVDPTSRKLIFELLARLNKTMTIILVTHDTLAIASEVKHIACLNKTLVYHGNPEVNESIVESLYGCPVDLLAHGVPHRVLGPKQN